MKDAIDPGVLISICIPTYNRSTLLDTLLESINAELSSIPEGSVEIIISDNASPDGTQLIGEKWQKQIDLHYIRHSQNKGPDFNMQFAGSLATGRYIWWIGDDDEILPGALATLINAICTTSPLAILSCKNDQHFVDHKNPSYSITNDINSFVHQHFSNMPLGALIVRRDLKLNDPLVLPGLQTYHFYAFYTYQVLGTYASTTNIQASILIFDGPLFKRNTAQKKWYSKELYKIYYEKVRIFLESLHPYFDPIRDDLRHHMIREITHYDTSFNCLRYAASKRHCLQLMMNYPMPIRYRIRLFVLLSFRASIVAVKTILRFLKLIPNPSDSA